MPNTQTVPLKQFRRELTRFRFMVQEGCRIIVTLCGRPIMAVTNVEEDSK